MKLLAWKEKKFAYMKANESCQEYVIREYIISS